MPRDVDRREFLTLAGSVAGAAAVAGCAGGGDETTEDGGDETTEDGGDETTEDGGDEMTESGDGDTATETEEEELPEPQTRQEHLQRANRVLHDEAPWIFLNRQYSVYGKSDDIDWEARRDERIDGYGIEPAGDASTVTITQSQMDSGLDPQDHRETPTALSK